MSNDSCKKCGRPQVHNEIGHVAGCGHYPPTGRMAGKFVNVWFGYENETPTQAFYSGAWYKSENSKLAGLSVHPVRWEASVDVVDPIRICNFY